jgi:hypothetical protein
LHAARQEHRLLPRGSGQEVIQPAFAILVERDIGRIVVEMEAQAFGDCLDADGRPQESSFKR